MGCHVVNLFCCAVKLDGITKFLIYARVGLYFIVWLMCGVLDGLLLLYFSLFRRVPGDMQQACFSSSWLIARMV